MGYPFTIARCEPTPNAFLEAGRKGFRKILGLFVGFHKVTVTDFRIDHTILDRISNRIYQRLNYYLFFHDKQLLQSHQAGLKAYWILRYRPLTIISTSSWKKVYDANAYFAFFVILCGILGEYLGDCKRDIQRLAVNKILVDYENTFIRSFSEYDISKEAMMLVADNIKEICLYEVKLHI